MPQLASDTQEERMFKSLAMAFALASAAVTSTAQQATPVVVLVKVFAAPGQADALQALYLKRLAFFRSTEPDSTFRLHRSTKDTNAFLWYEVYPSRVAYENHKVVNETFKREAGPMPAGLVASSESETFSELGQ